MFKYKYNGSLHTDENGVKYSPVKGVLTVPNKIKSFSHLLIKETKPELSGKDLLIEKALELKIGAKSSLKRLSIETLRERIEEAN